MRTIMAGERYWKAESGGYQVTVGFGGVYAVITEIKTGKEVFLQGDDVLTLEQDTHEYDNLNCLSDYFDN